jgi:hypothetical protein
MGESLGARRALPPPEIRRQKPETVSPSRSVTEKPTMATSAPHRRSISKPHGHHGNHHKKKQKSLLPAWITWERVNLGLTFVGSIVSLTGVFVVWAGTYSPSQIFTDAGLNRVLETSAAYQASGLASAVIAVPACIDALFDFYVIVKTWGTEEQRLQSKQGHIEHMSVFERLLFCAGMFSSLMSVFPYLPAPYLRVIYYINYSSINAILLICPIMIFLSRVNKKMWNDTMAFTIVSCVVVAALLQTASTLFPENSSIGNNLSVFSSVAMYMALGIYTFTFVVQMLRINYVRTKVRACCVRSSFLSLSLCRAGSLSIKCSHTYP